jgi:hypothetical protein
LRSSINGNWPTIARILLAALPAVNSRVPTQIRDRLRAVANGPAPIVRGGAATVCLARNGGVDDLENFRSEHGNKRIALLERKHLARLIARKAATLAAANNLLRMLRVLMQFAIADGMRRDDPIPAAELLRSSEQNRGIEFAPDSPLEENGFEPLVPLNLRRRRFQNTYSASPRAAQRRKSDPSNSRTLPP